MTVACKDCTPPDVAINWLEGMAMKAVVKQMTLQS